MNWLKRKIRAWLEIDIIEERLDDVDHNLDLVAEDAEKYTDETVENAITQYADDLSICGEDITSVVMNISSRLDDLETTVEMIDVDHISN